MKKEQIYKLLEVTIIAAAFMTFFEAIFAIPGVTDSISEWIHNLNQRWLLWLVIWLVMFIQVCIIPIPAYIVLNTAVNIGLISRNTNILTSLTSENFWIFVLVSISAYMAGAVVAYGMGYKYGRRTLMWCAGNPEDYEKWSLYLKTNGKWAYFATVLLPIFPDDLLCLVAGSIKFDFKFFLGSNFIGRTIGLITTLVALVVFNHVTNGTIPWSLIIWVFILSVLVISLLMLKKEIKKEQVK